MHRRLPLDREEGWEEKGGRRRIAWMVEGNSHHCTKYRNEDVEKKENLEWNHHLTQLSLSSVIPKRLKTSIIQ